MKTLAIAAALLALGATQSRAQPASSEQLDPIRLQLARKIMDVRGGETAVRAQITALYGSIAKMTASISPGAGKAAVVFQNAIRDGMLDAVPQLMESSIRIYARVLTAQEMTDYLAWLKSESGQSVVRKSPEITKQAVESQGPLLKTLLPQVMHKAVVAACDEQTTCTPQVRRQMMTAVDRALQASGT